MGIQISDTSINRISSKTGEQVGEWLEEEDHYEVEPVKDTEQVYVQVDGCHLLTREEKWKETKLGRVFKSSSILPQSTNRQWIRDSEYIGHLGGHKEFEQKMSRLVDQYEPIEERLIFVNDGAKWIEKWIKSEYPKAQMILDFYHGMENIGKLVKLCIKENKEKKDWMERTGKILKEEGIKKARERIEELEIKTKPQIEQKQKLATYLDRNECYMNYPEYIDKGYLIGSGAIESAHRNVLHKRLKQPGQRWSRKGLQNMINLRVLNKSGHWNLVSEHLGKIAA